jgi:uncharacterized membrane protein
MPANDFYILVGLSIFAVVVIAATIYRRREG